MAIVTTQILSASDSNSGEDEHRQKVAAKKGVQLHFSKRWEDQQRGKRNARLAAAAFIAIGVLIASGPFLISKFQRSVVSYNQSVNELVREEPDDGRGSGGFVPTFNPSMSIRNGTESSSHHSPLIKNELTTIRISSNDPTASPSIPTTISKPSLLHTAMATRSTSRGKSTFVPTSKEPTHNPSSLPTSTEQTGTPTTTSTTRHPIASIPMLPTSANASNHTTFRSTSSPTSRNSTSILAAPTNYPITSDPTASPSMHPTTASTSNPSTIKPSNSPSRIPSSSPTTREPTNMPSNQPTSKSPTGSPTTSLPTASPSTQPTTANPTSQPTFMPTNSPTKDPNSCPSPACMLNALLSWLTSNSSNQPTMATSSVQSTATNSSPSPSQHTSTFLALKPTASKPSSTAYSSYSPSSDASSVQPNSQALPSKDPTSQFASSDFFVTNATTSNTRAFSSHVRIVVKGIYELMDSGASEIMKENTVSFLNEQFLDLILVDDVTLISQSVTQSSEPIRALSMVSQQRWARLKTESSTDRSFLRSLTATLPPPSLVVELGVQGMITNWTAFREFNDVQVSGDFISTLLSQSISSNSEEFMDRLADESDFFPSVTPRVISYVVTEPVSSGEGGKGHLVYQILGLVVAMVALVGILYMTGVKRRRRLCDDELSRDAKDVREASVVELGSEDALNVSSGSLRSVSEAIVDDKAVSAACLENESMSTASVNSEVGSAASVDCEVVSATSMHDEENQSEYDSNCETSFDTDSFDSDIEVGNDEAESSTMSSSSYSSYDDSESIEVARIHSRTSRLDFVANPRGSNDVCEKKQSADYLCHDPKLVRACEENKSPYGMHNEVDCSIMSSTSPATMPALKGSGLRQLRHDGTTKQTVAFSGRDYRCAEEGGRNDEQRCRSGKHDEDSCQKGEENEEIWKSDEQDNMGSPMGTPASAPPPAGESFDPSAKQKSMKTRKSTPKSGRKLRRRYDCIEHSAYEVVLRDH